VELNHLTGTAIFHGPGLDWKYGNTIEDGQEFRIGKLRLTAIHTPGHTDESISYVLADLSTGQAPVMVFTGDALFVNEVGRTDLYGPAEAPRLAANLYDSIFHRILPLGDGVILCPAHGGGSVCGQNIADRDESTLGIEKSRTPGCKLETGMSSSNSRPPNAWKYRTISARWRGITWPDHPAGRSAGTTTAHPCRVQAEDRKRSSGD